MKETVLILVVVEYGLGEAKRLKQISFPCLNPCCGGIWSRSEAPVRHYRPLLVLILVVVEYGLGEERKDWFIVNSTVLILVVVEYGLGEGM